jgi:hypothetical protein
MRDRLLIGAGLAVFVGLFTLPVWRPLLANATPSSPTLPLPARQAGPSHCVRDTAWMRRNHMKLLMQVRDDVVHRGIRNRDETLPGCLNCHVSRLADRSFPAASSPKFFCNSCHNYVGVKTDCFSCHANRPEPGESTVARSSDTSLVGGDALVPTLVARQSQGSLQ